MTNFLTRLLLATFGASATVVVYGAIVVPNMISTVLTVVPFLLLSIVAFLYLDLTGSRRAASFAYLLGLFPFTLWICAILLIFRDAPGLNDELAGVLLIAYLVSAMGAYFCLVCWRGDAEQKSSGCN